MHHERHTYVSGNIRSGLRLYGVQLLSSLVAFSAALGCCALCVVCALCCVLYCKYLHLNVCCVRAECRLSIWCKHAAFCCCFAFLLHISVYYCTVCKVGLPAECVLLFRAAVSCCICVGHCTVVKCVPCNRLYLAYGHCWVWCANWHAKHSNLYLNEQRRKFGITIKSCEINGA